MSYTLKHYAYIGDSVFELFVRKIVVKKTNIQSTMHKLTTSIVNAQAQADILDKICDKLSEDELEIQKRGRNLKISINKKSNPKIHCLATSFEVLIGYLYLENPKRLEEILSFIEKEIELKL